MTSEQLGYYIGAFFLPLFLLYVLYKFKVSKKSLHPVFVFIISFLATTSLFGALNFDLGNQTVVSFGIGVSFLVFLYFNKKNNKSDV